MRVCIRWESGEVHAALRDTPTATALWEVMPFEGRANIWGDEVYFDAPIEAETEPDAREVVDAGSVCFWVAGSALALLFGPTPASHGDECRLISKANVVGMIEGDPTVLASVSSGEVVSVEQAEDPVR